MWARSVKLATSLCLFTWLAYQPGFCPSQQSVSSALAATFSSWHTNSGSDDQNDLNWDSFPLTSATLKKTYKHVVASSGFNSDALVMWKRHRTKKWETEADFFLTQTVDWSTHRLITAHKTAGGLTSLTKSPSCLPVSHYGYKTVLKTIPVTSPQLRSGGCPAGDVAEMCWEQGLYTASVMMIWRTVMFQCFNVKCFLWHFGFCVMWNEPFCVQKHALYKKVKKTKHKYRRRRPRLVYVGAVRLTKR